MTGINDQFADNPQFNIFGQVTGSASVNYFPSGSAKLLRFKADEDNSGVFKLGGLPFEQTFFPLSAGEDTGWVAPPSADGNLRGLNNYCYSNSASTGSYELLYYWIQN